MSAFAHRQRAQRNRPQQALSPISAAATCLFQHPRVQQCCVVVQAASGVGLLRRRQRGVIALLLLLLCGGVLADAIHGRRRRDRDALPVVRCLLRVCGQTGGEDCHDGELRGHGRGRWDCGVLAPGGQA